MVLTTLATQDATVATKKVWASQGKYARAEPVSALYEQGRVHHVGLFAALEDELCDWVPGEGLPSPNRLDALVWALTELMLGGEVPLPAGRPAPGPAGACGSRPHRPPGMRPRRVFRSDFPPGLEEERVARWKPGCTTTGCSDLFQQLDAYPFPFGSTICSLSTTMSDEDLRSLPYPRLRDQAVSVDMVFAQWKGRYLAFWEVMEH